MSYTKICLKIHLGKKRRRLLFYLGENLIQLVNNVLGIWRNN